MPQENEPDLCMSRRFEKRDVISSDAIISAPKLRFDGSQTKHLRALTVGILSKKHMYISKNSSVYIIYIYIYIIIWFANDFVQNCFIQINGSFLTYLNFFKISSSSCALRNRILQRLWLRGEILARWHPVPNVSSDTQGLNKQGLTKSTSFSSDWSQYKQDVGKPKMEEKVRIHRKFTQIVFRHPLMMHVKLSFWKVTLDHKLWFWWSWCRF